MKKLACILLTIAIVSFLIIGNCFALDFIDKSEAESVLNNYFSHLKSGDTDRILNLLTGPFLKKRERLLRYNPEYPNFLRNKYEYAQFAILGHRLIDAKKLALDVQIILNDQDRLKTRFVLVQNKGLLKIYSEEKIPQP